MNIEKLNKPEHLNVVFYTEGEEFGVEIGGNRYAADKRFKAELKEMVGDYTNQSKIHDLELKNERLKLKIEKIEQFIDVACGALNKAYQ